MVFRQALIVALVGCCAIVAFANEPVRVRVTDQLMCFNNYCVDKESVCAARPRQCKAYQFQCLSGKCIESDDACNGRNDCGDWSDENPDYCARHGHRAGGAVPHSSFSRLVF